MLRVYDRLQSHTSSLAVPSSELGNNGHNEWSRVFCYPCMDGPVHTVLPNLSEEIVQISTRFLKWEIFLTGNTCIFARTLIFLCKYCTFVMEKNKFFVSVGYFCGCSNRKISNSRAEAICKNISSCAPISKLSEHVFVNFALLDYVEMAELSKSEGNRFVKPCTISDLSHHQILIKWKLAISKGWRWRRLSSAISVCPLSLPLKMLFMSQQQ